MTLIELPRTVASTSTGNITLTAGEHSPVDATSGSVTVTLPTGLNPGAHLSVEKVDASSNAVILSGTIRGTSGTLTLTGQYESVELRAEADGNSWRPTGNNLPKTVIDGKIAAQAAADGDMYAPTASPTFTGLFGFGTPGTAGIPFGLAQVVNASSAIAAGSTNIVGTQFNTTFLGDYTTMAGSDPGFLFGGDHYTTVGDVQGVNTVEGWIGEVSITKPSGTIPTVIGTEAGVSFAGPAGATVTTAISLLVADPTRRVQGATGGTVTHAYGLFVDAVTAGTADNLSVFVEGGVSRFGGRVDVTNNISNAGGGNLDLFAGFGTSDGAKLTLEKTSGDSGGHVLVQAYGLAIAPTTPRTAADLSLQVQGGISLFQGRVDVWNNISNAGGGDLDIYAGHTTVDGAHLGLASAANGGHAVAYLQTPSSFLFVHDGSNVKHALGNSGVLGVGSYPDSAGGAGPMIFLANATTPPAGAPVGGAIFYVQGGAVKIRGGSGTITTIAVA